VVEKAHRRPRFVEDCVREMIKGVVDHLPDLAPRRVRLPPARRTSRPSHQHNVVAEALRACSPSSSTSSGSGEHAERHTPMRAWLRRREFDDSLLTTARPVSSSAAPGCRGPQMMRRPPASSVDPCAPCRRCSSRSPTAAAVRPGRWRCRCGPGLGRGMGRPRASALGLMLRWGARDLAGRPCSARSPPRSTATACSPRLGGRDPRRRAEALICVTLINTYILPLERRPAVQRFAGIGVLFRRRPWRRP